jgi:hypothetical protein
MFSAIIKTSPAHQRVMSLLVKMLGIVDVLCAVALGFHDIFPLRLLLTLGALLVFKGLIFHGDPVSVFDVILGCYVLLTLVVNFTPLSILFAIYLGIKGAFSMF